MDLSQSLSRDRSQYTHTMTIITVKIMRTVTRRPGAKGTKDLFMQTFVLQNVRLTLYSSVFFQLPVTEQKHFLPPLFDAIGLKEKNQYLRYDYNQVPHGTCFKQSVFAGNFLTYTKISIVCELSNFNIPYRPTQTKLLSCFKT